MSLRLIHIVVILFSIAITVFFGFWAVQNSRDTGEITNLYWGIASLIGAAVLIPYLIWFILKTRKNL